MVVSGVNIQPNRTGLPGIASLESIVGALLTFGLIAAVAGIAISSIAWAIGSHSGNPHVAGKGKSGVLVALGAAFLIGGATFLVNFFNAQGGLAADNPHVHRLRTGGQTRAVSYALGLPSLAILSRQIFIGFRHVGDPHILRVI